jgi:hypothetical protein
MGKMMKKNALKIERGIKLPDRTRGTRNPMIAMLEKMKDGDSFLYPMLKRPELSYCARKAGVVITTRMVDETTVRCWRVKKSFVNGRYTA